MQKLLLRYFALIILTGILINISWAQDERTERFYRGTPTNPMIQAMVDSVSPDSILSYLENIVGFYTRHTLSDTVSPDTGIGAARRWIKSKYQQWSDASGGALQPSFFWFSATICGTTREHANVMATLPGTMPQAQNRYFIVSGHMDGRTFGVCDATSFAPSANDDGSGTASSIEAARVMSAFSFDASLIFMTVTGEDQGLFGSTAYADWAAANNMRIDGMLTNDVIGNIVAPDSTIDSTSVRHFSEDPSTSPSRQLARYFKLKGEQYVPSMTVNLIPAQDRPGRGGDHMPFNDNGYAAVRFTEPAERLEYQHSDLDLIEHMSPAYTAQVTRLTVAGLASMALAPETPQAPLQVFDVGNGSEVFLTWSVTNTEPDFAGYRIAWRFADSLFYETIIPVGNVTEFTLTGLTPNEPIFISYSALDTDGNESIFSQEVLVTPSNIPAIPQNFTATSTPAHILLQWTANSELDLESYRITRTDPNNNSVTFTVDSSATEFMDNTAQPHTMYQYFIQAKDVDGNVSAPSGTVIGQLATHDSGILVVDDSKDGPGGNPLFPSDQEVDDYYDQILSNFSVTQQWDVADSVTAGTIMEDAHLGVYSTVIWHSDVRIPDNPISENITALRKYVQNGGHLLFVGWQLVSSASGLNQTVMSFAPGDFVYDVMYMDTVNTNPQLDFQGATAQLPGYPSISVDSNKVPPGFGGKLTSMEVFASLVGGAETEVIFHYNSASDPPSPFDGQPVALRHLGSDGQVIVLGFPLYYMEQPTAQQVITRALLDLGEVTGIEDESPVLEAGNLKFELLQNYPNPFNPRTQITYRLPVASEVDLTVFNLLGQRIKTLVRQKQDSGSYTVEWDGKDDLGRDVASGIYLFRLSAENFEQVRKMILLR